MKVYKVRGCDALSDYDFNGLKKIDPDLFVYSYEYGSYEGSGFAVWRKDGKYGYAYLGHCSCNGPLEDVNSIYYSLKDMKKIVANANSYEKDYAVAVMKRLERVLENELKR